MPRASLLLALLVLPAALIPAGPAAAQVTDTLFTWRNYGRMTPSTCRVRLYRATAGDQKATHVAVVEEVAANRGTSTVDDAGFMAEVVARTLALDPTQTRWVFHWHATSFAGAEKSRKELFLAASFHWLKSGKLGSPSWRVVRREEVEVWTDRLFR